MEKNIGKTIPEDKNTQKNYLLRVWKVHLRDGTCDVAVILEGGRGDLCSYVRTMSD